MSDSLQPSSLPFPSQSPGPGSRVREFVRHELVRRTLTVAAIRPLTAHITRLTLTGDDLAGFSSQGPEDHVKVFFATASGDLARRDYTPAVFREHGQSGGPELDLDFVLHGDTGPASAWAGRAAIGDTVTIGGPRGSRLAPRGYRCFVLLADESSLPAMSRWIEAVRFDAEVVAFVQSDDVNVLDYPVPTGDRVAVTRIAPGADAALTALGGLHLDEDTYIWAAGEASALVPVRRRLRRELELDKNDLKVDGYWKLGVAELDHHAPLDPEDPEDPED